MLLQNVPKGLSLCLIEVSRYRVIKSVNLVCLVFSASLLVVGVVSTLGVAVILVLVVLSMLISSVVVSVSVLVSLPLAIIVTGSAS